jgi:large conductance mechanosensitive channel
MVLKEFREFIARGNVMDMAVGIIIGAAFGAIVNSLVNDVVMPPIGLLLGKVDFSNMFIVLRQGATPGPYPSLASAKAAGAVSINVGLFINAAVSFVIVALSVFLMVKAVNQLKRTKAASAVAATTKPCPRCCSDIPAKATRCPHCTSELGQHGQA